MVVVKPEAWSDAQRSAVPCARGSLSWNLCSGKGVV